MAPQIQRARAALRAIHRMDALRRASHEGETDVEAGQQPDDDMQAAEDDLQQPLLDTTRTPQEAVAADVRTSRASSEALDSAADRGNNNIWLTCTILHNHAAVCLTPVDVIAAPGQGRKPPSALNSFRGAVQDIQEAQQHLNRANSSMAGLSDAERRAKVLGLFAGASSWRGGTGMGLPKEIKTADSEQGPGRHWFALAWLMVHCICRQCQLCSTCTSSNGMLLVQVGLLSRVMPRQYMV